MAQTYLIFTIIIALFNVAIWFWLYDYWIVTSTNVVSKFWITFGKLAIGLFTSFLITLPIYTIKENSAIFWFSTPSLIIPLVIGQVTYMIKKHFFIKSLNKNEKPDMIQTKDEDRVNKGK